MLQRNGPRSLQGEGKKGWAIASLALGILSVPTLGLLGIGALLGILFGIVALVKASREPRVYAGKGIAIAGVAFSALSFLLIPILGIIAAIAIPTLLRSRVAANETAAIGDLRAFASAEMAYQAANDGLYDTPECLSSPARCIPGYLQAGPGFLPAETLKPVRHGYVWTFHPGLTAPAAGRSSPSSMRSFAYSAVPQTWNRTGTRGFCADSTGRLCSIRFENPALVSDGLCALSCRPLS